MRHRRILAIVVMLGLALAACGPAASPTSAVTPTSAPAVRATAAPATSTPLPGATAQPSATPRPTSTPTTVAVVKAKTGGVLRVSMIEDPPAWDAMATSNSAPVLRALNGVVFDTLARTGGSAPPKSCSFAIEKNLAASWKYLDPLTLEIKIPQGVKFQNKPLVNGRELTAEDVAYSLRRLLKVNLRMSTIVPYIAGIEAKDGNTVVISLTKPHSGITSAAFLGNKYTSGILAKESGGTKESWADPYTSWVGTGPFMFQQYLNGVRTIFERNSGYRKPGLPYLDRIEFPIMPDAGTRTAALRSGRVDASTQFGLSWPMVRELGTTSPSIKVFQCPGFSQAMSSWRIDEPPFNDVRVRRAVSMLLDRKALAEKVWEGQATVVALGSSQIDPSFLDVEGFPPETRKYLEYRPEEAMRLLAEAGYPGGKGLEVAFTHTMAHPRSFIEWSEFLIAAMGRAGITVKPTWMEYGRYSTTYTRGDFHSLGTGGLSASDPYIVFELWLSTASAAQNKPRVKDPELDRLIAEFTGTIEEAKAKELARQIQVRIVDQVYVLVSPLPYTYAVWQPWVHDYLLADEPSSGLWAEKVWLDR
ncbi:MAG: ABC transporter substrate-binding protein [Chloroflexi bacterium]|nr:ABC transporter substrate-binding protein [Chloroflexota bacterium]